MVSLTEYDARQFFILLALFSYIPAIIKPQVKLNQWLSASTLTYVQWYMEDPCLHFLLISSLFKWI